MMEWDRQGFFIIWLLWYGGQGPAIPKQRQSQEHSSTERVRTLAKSQQPAGLTAPKPDSTIKRSKTTLNQDKPLRAYGVNSGVHVIAATCSLPFLVDVPKLDRVGMKAGKA